MEVEELTEVLHEVLRAYRKTLPHDRKALLEQFRPVHEIAKAAYDKLIDSLVKLDPGSVMEPVVLDWDTGLVRDETEAVAEALIARPTTPAGWEGQIRRNIWR